MILSYHCNQIGEILAKNVLLTFQMEQNGMFYGKL